MLCQLKTIVSYCECIFPTKIHLHFFSGLHRSASRQKIFIVVHFFEEEHEEKSDGVFFILQLS